ncbi:hypothetical protein GCM10009619_42030 [Williamsia maris]
MTVLVIVVVGVIVFCAASMVTAVVFGRIVAGADRDARLQEHEFRRIAALSGTTHTAA